MKRTLYLLLLAMAFGYASCDHSPKQPSNTQKPSVANSELAVLDKGQLSFYDLNSQEFVAFDQETDSAVNGVFANDGKFYYSVVVNDQILLKYVDLNQNELKPVTLGDWGVDPSHCVSELYDEFAGLEYYPKKGLLGLEHEFSWDGYGFYEKRIYNLATGEVKDYNWETDESLWDDDDSGDDEHEGEFETIDEQAVYHDGDKTVCLSDQMNVKQYASDPDYTIDLNFDYFEKNPQGDMVRFAAPIDAGDFEHGPWCVASLDGKFQKVLKGTDFCTGNAQWLSNGALVFHGAEPRPHNDPDYDPEWNNTRPCIMIMKPNHEITVLSHANDFFVK